MLVWISCVNLIDTSVVALGLSYSIFGELHAWILTSESYDESGFFRKASSKAVLYFSLYLNYSESIILSLIDSTPSSLSVARRAETAVVLSYSRDHVDDKKWRTLAVTATLLLLRTCSLECNRWTFCAMRKRIPETTCWRGKWGEKKPRQNLGFRRYVIATKGVVPYKVP